MKFLLGVFLLCLSLQYSNFVRAEGVIGTWTDKGKSSMKIPATYTLRRTNGVYYMEIKKENKEYKSKLNKFRSKKFPLPSYEVNDGYQKEDKIIYAINVHNRLGIRLDGKILGTGQPSRKPEHIKAIKKEFLKYHVSPEF